MGKVIGRLPVVYDPAARRVQVESSAEFVETQLCSGWTIWPTGSPFA